MPAAALKFLAGPSALAEILEGGFDPARIRVVAGASGGPKWLVLNGLDRVLPRVLSAERASPLFLVGSSIGAWRLACHAQSDPLAALDRFEAAYLDQRYSAKPSPREVTERSREILDALLGDRGVDEILSHPTLRLSVITARCTPITAPEGKLQAGGLALAATANLVSRRALGAFFRRAIFFDPRTTPPFHAPDDLPTDSLPLDAGNLADVVLASGSIPMVFEGVRDIPGSPPGIHRDGGIVDYHFDMPLVDGEGIVFYPHFYPDLTPGWFDKFVPWRRSGSETTDRMLIVCPSPAFVEGLPFGKIPDRRDFYALDDDSRLAYWRTVLAESRRLGEELEEVIDREAVPARLEPIGAPD